MQRIPSILSGLVVSILVLLAWVAPVGADDLLPSWSAPDQVAHHLPALTISPTGAATIAWLRIEPDQPSPLIYIADLPEGPSLAMGQLPPNVTIDQVQIVFGQHAGPRLAWLAPLTDTVSIETTPLTGNGQRQRYLAPLASPNALALDAQQAPYYAWANDKQINVLDLAQGVTQTIAIPVATMPQQLSLQVDDSNIGHLVWVGRASSIHYANTISGTTPITVTTVGSDPQLSVDATGHPHLLWRRGNQLFYANDQNWPEPTLVAQAQGIGTIALSVSPQGQAEAAWSTPDGIWYAHSLDWQLTRRLLIQAEQVETLTLGLDHQGGAHLAWTQAEPAIGTSLHYLADVNPALQVQVNYPLAGMQLVAGDSVHAITNPPSKGWRQVTFYLASPDKETSGPDAWQMIGSDRDSHDGWSMTLPGSVLPGRYRAMALAISHQGETCLAQGELFVLGPDIGGQVAISSEMMMPLRGRAALEILWMPAPGDPPPEPIALDMYLEPEQCAELDSACQVTKSPPTMARYYVGRQVLTASEALATYSLPMDTAQIPDGRYRVTARNAADGFWWPISDAGLEIDNAMPPSISVNMPQGGEVVRDVLQAQAEAYDPNGLVTRVDFYLERDFSLFESTSASITAPDRLWVGGDSSGSDGWTLDALVDSAWRGADWRLLAVAQDQDGFTQTAYSPDVVRILAPTAPALRILRPNGDRPLHGHERIVLSPDSGPAAIQAIKVYLERPDQSLQWLGAMQGQWPNWLLDWDTTTAADGEYRLQFIATVDDASPALRQESAWFRISNQSVQYVIAEPQQDASLQGAQIIRLRETGALSALSWVRFFWRDMDGTLHPIGQDVSPDNDWGILWQTAGALDGAYSIVAQLQDHQGRQSTIERDVVLRNHTPWISLSSNTNVVWSGEQNIAWQATHPTGRPLTVSVSYSPDDGQHWLLLARDLAANQSLAWDTTGIPDSTNARLRLTVSDGEHWSQAVSPAFSIDNRNHAPRVTLLSPQANSSYSAGEMVVAWQAFDPDSHRRGAALKVDLDYRVQGSGWRQIRYDLGPAGAFVWDDAWLVPGTRYDLRITVQDAGGAQAAHTVQNIRLIDNHPPTIRLLWPNTPVKLGNEAIILWQAQDEDGDPLTIDLYYSDNGGQAWLPLAEKLDNTSYFGWQLSFLPPSDQYRLRAVVSDGKSSSVGESQSTFVVGQRQQQMVNLLSPRPERILTGIELVRWSTLNSQGQGQAEIEVRSADEQAWQQLAQLPNQGFYLWDTRTLNDGAYDLRVTISDTLCCTAAVTADPLLIDNSANRAPQVKLLAPLGGERWGGLHEIRWDTFDSDNDALTATLSISHDQGLRWQRLDAVDGRLGSYLWDTRPVTMTQDLLVAVAVGDGKTVTRAMTARPVALLNQLNLPPQVSIISPSPSGVLLRGDTLAWRADDSDLEPLRIAIWQSQTAGRSWIPVAQHLANTGQYVLDQALPTDQDTRFQIVASDGIWASQSTSAASRPQLPESMRAEIELVSPRAGMRLAQDQEIAWQVTAPAGTAWQVALDISADGGLSWVPLSQTLDLQGALVWDTTSVANGTYQLRVAASNERIRQSLVTAPLIVNNQSWLPSKLSLLSPAGEEIWSGLQEIQWQATDAQGRALPVDLEYSADRGSTWMSIARNLRGVGGYTWDTTRAPNCEELWLRISFEREGFRRQALSQAPIAVRNVIGPMARLELPSDGAHWRGRQVIAWQAVGEPGRPLRIILEASLDHGKSWQELARDLPTQGRYSWDTSDLARQSRALIRLRAFDRGLTAVDTIWSPIMVNPQRPAQLPPFYLP